VYPKLHEQLDKLVEASKGVKELLGHSRHEDLLLAPVSPECVPRGQLVQSSASSWPVTSVADITALPYLPAAHSVHIDAAAKAYVPAPQAVQTVEPAVLENLPAAH
jgi:hypothetical protein